MVDPTKMNEDLRRKGKKVSGYYGKIFATGILGGGLGGIVFLAMKGFLQIDSFPMLILSGIGVVAMYLYFTDQSERNRRQIPFLFLAGLVSVLVLLLLYIVIDLYKSGSGVTLQNIFDAYFRNRAPSIINNTLLFHLVALFFEAIGIGGAWLYVAISVPRWEKKHGTHEAPRGRRRKARGG